MENSPLTVELAALFIGFGVGVGGIVWWVSSRFRAIEREHATFREKVAETYATKKSVDSGFENMTAEVRQLREDLTAGLNRLSDLWTKHWSGEARDRS